MATGRVVITDANDETPAVAGIFANLKFFLVQRLPSRSHFIAKIEANGGSIVRLEQQADHVIADHMRPDCPAGSLSFTFIDKAIANGELPNPADHSAGPAPGHMREVGSSLPTKGTRTPFTAEDDRVLWLWVEQAKSKGSRYLKGNQIYQDLAKKNSRHTFQAWRDRYIKYLMDKPPAGVEGVELTVAANAPPSPPTAQDAQVEIITSPTTKPEDAVSTQAVRGSVAGDDGNRLDEAEDREAADAEEELEFTEQDFNALLSEAADIENIADDQLSEAWAAFQSQRPDHSVRAWRIFYYEQVRPTYLQQRAERKAAKAEKRRQRQMSESAVADYVAAQQAIENLATQSRTLQGPSVSTVADPNAAQQVLEDLAAQKGVSVSPLRPGSSDSQKLKRKLDDVQSEAEDSHKKWKSAELDTASREHERSHLRDQQTLNTPQAPGAISSQPIELLSSDDEEQREAERDNMPTSELNRGAQMQLEAEQQMERAKAFLTSESYITAQSQLLSGEANRSDPPLVINSAPLVSDPPMSRSNIQVAQVHDTISEAPAQIIDGEPALPTTPPLQSHNVTQHQLSQITPTRLLKTNGDLLTEANLASQQAQHKQDLLRGTDLPEDDDAQDQTEYLNVLQDLVNNPGATTASAFRQHSSLRDDTSNANVDLPSQGISLGLDEFDLGPNQDLPLSSQQEIDDAFAAAVNWPESPKVSQRVVVQPESVQFETQVQYPELPVHQEDEPRYAAHPAVMSQVNYPSVEQQVQEILDQDASAHDRNGESLLVEKESSYVVIEQEADSSSSASDDDEVDLSIAAPEGGWDQATPGKSARTLRQEQLEGIQGDGEVVAVEEELVEVSSDSSSTSSSSESSDEGRGPNHTRPRTVLETQDIVNAETQQPDLDLPLPSDESEVSSSEEASPLTSSPSKKWSMTEDQAIVEGSRARMPVSQILKKYNLNRTPSALRNRRAVLLKHPELLYSPRKPAVGKVISRSKVKLERLPDEESSDASSVSEDEDLVDDMFPSSPSEDLSSPIKAATAESQRNLPNIQRPPEEDIDSYVNKMIVFGYKEQAIINALKCTSMRPELADYVLLEEKAGKGLPADVAGVWSEEEDRTLESGNARGLKALEEKHTWKECEERMTFLEEWRDED